MLAKQPADISAQETPLPTMDQLDSAYSGSHHAFNITHEQHHEDNEQPSLCPITSIMFAVKSGVTDLHAPGQTAEMMKLPVASFPSDITLQQQMSNTHLASSRGTAPWNTTPSSTCSEPAATLVKKVYAPQQHVYGHSAHPSLITPQPCPESSSNLASQAFSKQTCSQEASLNLPIIQPSSLSTAHPTNSFPKYRRNCRDFSLSVLSKVC